MFSRLKQNMQLDRKRWKCSNVGLIEVCYLPMMNYSSRLSLPIYFCYYPISSLVDDIGEGGKVTLRP